MIGQPPRVSIGLPVYNGENFLAEAIESLLAQTFTDFELIISDNASTDATAEICRRYAAQDPRICYYRSPQNRGCAWNYTRVFELAEGLYFKWAAHDDLCAPEFLARGVEVLDAEPSVAWCHPRTSHIDSVGRVLADAELQDIGYLTGNARQRQTPGWTPPELSRGSPRPSQRFRSVLLGTSSCLDNFGLVRRDVMRKTHLQLPYYGSDKIFSAELCLYGRFQEIPQTLFFVRVHSEGSGALATAAQQQAFVDPSRRRLSLTRLHLLLGYLRVIRRAPLPLRERMSCYAAVAQYLFQFRKWGRVLRTMLRGSGTGGGYAAVVDQPPATNGTAVMNSQHPTTVH